MSMAPRNHGLDSDYPKDCPSDIDTKDVIPEILHKKHKVVKLVKQQMQKLQDEGLCNGDLALLMEIEENSQGVVKGDLGETGSSQRLRRMDDQDLGSDGSAGFRMSLLGHLLLILLMAFILIYLMVRISSGPLSNSSAHTPIPIGSFVKIDSICTLEKKYLLRWSKPDYFE